MKRIATALVLGSLIVATQAASADAFPAGSVDYWFTHQLPASSSYADAHAGDPVMSIAPEFPEGSNRENWDPLPASSSYEDAHAGDPVASTGPAFPVGTERYWGLDAPSEYAGSHLQDPLRFSAAPQNNDTSE